VGNILRRLRRQVTWGRNGSFSLVSQQPLYLSEPAPGRPGTPGIGLQTSERSCSSGNMLRYSSNSGRRWRRGRPAPRLRQSWWTRQGGRLLLGLFLVAAVAGCCSQTPTTLPPPILPPGKPKDMTAELLKLETKWTDTGQRVTMPHHDLRLILSDRSRWRAWARALQAAGRWRK
jgi:hypothetical protein